MPRAKTAYIRWLETGLTFEGAVWRAGSVCATDNVDFADLTAEEQERRYGAVYFERITKAQYEELGGEVRTTRRTAQRSPAKKPKRAPVEPSPHGTPPPTKGEWKPLGEDTAEGDTTEEDAEAGGGVETDTAPFPGYDEADVSETLDIVATFGDDAVQEFLAYERANRNRPEVIQALETGEIPD